jgi:hypothetical protein
MQAGRSLKQLQREIKISPPKLEWIRSGIEDFLPSAHRQ